jgi:hypothetical protein
VPKETLHSYPTGKDTTTNRLGNTVKDKNLRLAAVLKGVDGLGFGEFEDNQLRDVLRVEKFAP